jgi:circadian clock protein KaiB
MTGDAQRWVLRLYVAGATPASQRAVANLTSLCNEHLPDRYELEVIDLYQRPELAEAEQILAAPTLVRVEPPPPVRIVGDLSERERVRESLGFPRAA